jgi:small subunit ribosomal protein S21
LNGEPATTQPRAKGRRTGARGAEEKKQPTAAVERISRFAIHGVVCEGPGPLANPSESVQCKPLQVVVDGKGVERAIKHLKRKLAAEGLLRELKKRRHYMKPSIKKRKKIAEAARRRRKRERIIE